MQRLHGGALYLAGTAFGSPPPYCCLYPCSYCTLKGGGSGRRLPRTPARATTRLKRPPLRRSSTRCWTETFPPPPRTRTKWTRRVRHPVLIGHAASLSQVAAGTTSEPGKGGALFATAGAAASFERSRFHGNRADGSDGEGGCFMLLNRASLTARDSVVNASRAAYGAVLTPPTPPPPPPLPGRSAAPGIVRTSRRPLCAAPGADAAGAGADRCCGWTRSRWGASRCCSTTPRWPGTTRAASAPSSRCTRTPTPCSAPSPTPLVPPPPPPLSY